MTRSPNEKNWFEPLDPSGTSFDAAFEIGESYSGMNVRIPVHVRRSPNDGPTVFVTAALHGDELNGTGAIRQLILDSTFQPTKGTVILIPVLNVLAYDRHSRYLPDRRDLNRCFPGSPQGTLAGRMARHIYDELVSRCDFGIDLHTAALRRTNFPNVRADMTNKSVAKIAKAFGVPLIISNRGPEGSFRRVATEAGCSTITFEGGEVWKVESTICEYIVRGVRNVLCRLGMLQDSLAEPASQSVVGQTKWVRADYGGFLRFHVAPGDVIEAGQPLATNTTLLGQEKNQLVAPFAAVVLGMTTLPSVSPGDPVCHLGQLSPAELQQTRQPGRSLHDSLHRRTKTELATNVHVVEPQDHPFLNDETENR
ncbi:MAG: succinylglutamate desuccinylase/aspartoacylase family protein [Planctomycetales bacterium]|nr:succinylglutamate desuccinylase/aspartoacylase family protein [Planctomycetales bacterium]